MLDKPVFVLVEPQLGENIGMSARAMCNFGFRRLRLVAPRDGYPCRSAQATSAGALSLMEVEVFDTLASAVDDLQTLFATTARDRKHREVTKFPSDFAQMPSIFLPSSGVLFGAERRGLTNAQIACCQSCFKIPVDERFPSINLAQSVGMVAYSLSLFYRDFTGGFSEVEQHKKDEKDTEAAKHSVFALYNLVVDALEDQGYFSDDDRASKKLRIQSIFHRKNLSDADVRLLFGVFKHFIHSKR